jgi:hypothetical protein
MLLKGGKHLPSWKQLYAAAISESRPPERRLLIAETQRAIALRLKEIANKPDLAAERLELDNAATAVEILLREPLAWQNFEAQ